MVLSSFMLFPPLPPLLFFYEGHGSTKTLGTCPRDPNFFLLITFEPDLKIPLLDIKKIQNLILRSGIYFLMEKGLEK